MAGSSELSLKFCHSCRCYRNGPLKLFPKLRDEEDGDALSLLGVVAQAQETETLEKWHHKERASVEERHCKERALVEERHGKEWASVEERHRRERASVEERHRRERASVEERHCRERALVDEMHCNERASVLESHRKEQAWVDERHCKERASLQQMSVAYQKKILDFDFTLEMRQLFNDFKQKTSVDTQLLERVHALHYGDFGISTTKSFSRMVILLATEKIMLEKKMKDLNLSSYPRHGDSRESLTDKINEVERQLASLKNVATTFKTNEMRWSESIGEQYYTWCFLVLDANEACHPEITEEVQDHMYRLALNKKIKFGGELDEIVKAVIDKLRELLLRNECPEGSQHSYRGCVGI